MKSSFWFIKASVFFTPKDGDTIVEVKLNIALELDSEDFMPGSVRNLIRTQMAKNLERKGRSYEGDLEIVVDSFSQITQAGYADFHDEDNGSYSHCTNWVIKGREFCQRKSVVVSTSIKSTTFNM